MFHFIKGSIALLRPSLAVIEAGGVGFKLTVSDRTYSALSPLYSKGESAKLYTHLAVREDDMELFGFFDEQELDTFKLLITVSGVGPKAAMAILPPSLPKNSRWPYAPRIKSPSPAPMASVPRPPRASF